MAERFFNIEDCRNKMQSSIIMWEKKPYVVSIPRDFNGRMVDICPVHVFTDTTKRKYISVDYTDDRFDVNSIELGWFYQPRSNLVFHLCRRPGRFNNVGLLPNNVDQRIENYLFYSEEMENCILGRHYDYQTALKNLWKGDHDRIPFHRHAAVHRINSKNGQISYMNKIVAMVFEGSREIVPLKHSTSDYRDLLKKIGVDT